MFIQRAIVATSIVLAACGGSDSDRRQDAIDQADRKEAEARAAGVTAPCASASQCGALTFGSTSAGCNTADYKAYSLVSATAAAASAAAAQQNGFAATARSLDPSPAVLCPAVVTPAPTPTCVANNCGLVDAAGSPLP